MKFLELYFTFARIALYGVGGGYSMLPVLTRVLTEEKKWVTEEELWDYYAVGQCTPGIIAVNTATFVGIKRGGGSSVGGILGGVIATLGLITPSFILMIIVAVLSERLSAAISSDVFVRVLHGMKSGICALIMFSVSKMVKSGITDMFTFFMYTAAVAAIFLKISPVYLVVAAIAVGVITSKKKR